VRNAVPQAELAERLEGIPDGLLRLKGRIPASGGSSLDVQCVDSRWTIKVEEDDIEEGYLVAIGRREGGDDWLQWTSELFAWLQGQPAEGHPDPAELQREHRPDHEEWEDL
jgi:hypothetical protein